MTPGPNLWRIHSDLHFLKESFGQAASFQSVATTSQAAMLRIVAHYGIWKRTKQEGGRNGNILSIHDMHSRIVSLRSRTNFPDRVIAWSKWYINSIIFNLVNNQQNIEKEYGLFLNVFMEKLVGPDGWNPESTQRVKGKVQREIVAAIKKKQHPDPQTRLRDKIKNGIPKVPRLVPPFMTGGPLPTTSWPVPPTRLLPESTVYLSS